MTEVLSPDQVKVLVLVLFFAIVLIDILLAVDKRKRNTISQVITDRAKKERFWVPLAFTLVCVFLPLHFFGELMFQGDWVVIGACLLGAGLGAVMAKYIL